MLSVAVAAGSVQQSALTLLYSHLPRGEREQQLAELLSAVQRGEVTLDDLQVALEDGVPVGAILAVRRPGRMAFLWPPVLRPGFDDRAIARMLLERTAERMDRAGVVVTQCLVEPGDNLNRELLRSTGFPHGTEILLLTHALEAGPALLPGIASRVAIRQYTRTRHDEFASVIERTYVDTLDCPALARERRGADALVGYRACPDFDPALWMIAEIDRAPVGILLANNHQERSSREFVYLGIVPEARRQGIARALLLSALASAAEDDVECCEVAVDGANHRALSLYRSLGFEEQRRLFVHLRLKSSS